jgi:hypothetical protein
MDYGRLPDVLVELIESYLFATTVVELVTPVSIDELEYKDGVLERWECQDYKIQGDEYVKHMPPVRRVGYTQEMFDTVCSDGWNYSILEIDMTNLIIKKDFSFGKWVCIQEVYGVPSSITNVYITGRRGLYRPLPENMMETLLESDESSWLNIPNDLIPDEYAIEVLRRDF